MRFFKIRLPSKLIVIIVVAVSLVLLLGGVLLFIIWGKEPPPPPQEAKFVPARPPIVKILDYPMAPFFLPLAGIEKGERFLKIEIDLELSNQEVSGEIDRNLAILRENLLFLFKKKTLRDLQSDKNKIKLSKEIITTLNRSLQSGIIKKVYFTEFLVL
ncbi:MAG: flagellar basal body-associated FliL family protein [Nitrospinota bacterium]